MEEKMRKAAGDGDVDAVRRLVGTEGADPDPAAADYLKSYMYTPLQYACRNGRLAVVEYLVGEVGVDTNRAGAGRLTALHLACRRDRDPHVRYLPLVRYLVESGGANVLAETVSGNTPLHIASSTGHADIVQYLVEHQQANVDAKNHDGLTPLDQAVANQRKDVIRYLLPRTSSINGRILERLWRYGSLLEFRMMMLEKYALGRGLENAFIRNPIHTLFLEFPLPSTMALRCSITLFPSSVLSVLDKQGRHSMHVALTAQKIRHLSIHVLSRKALVRSPSIIRLLFNREPRLALAKDPTTGLYPHETVAGLVSNYNYEDDVAWFNIVYMMFRWNPNHFLQSRAMRTRHASSADAEECVGEEPNPSKRLKMEPSPFRE